MPTTEIQIDENDLWLCLASLEKHSSTPVEGGERLIFSFVMLTWITLENGMTKQKNPA